MLRPIREPIHDMCDIVRGIGAMTRTREPESLLGVLRAG